MKTPVTLCAVLVLLPMSLFAGVAPLGSASLQVTESAPANQPATRRILIHNLGSSGQDGVSIRSGPSSGGSLDYTWIPLSGDTFQALLAGSHDPNGTGEFPAGGITYSDVSTNQFTLTPAFAATGATHMTIQITQGGTILQQVSVTLTNSVGTSQSVSGGRTLAGAASPQGALAANVGHLSLLSQSASSADGSGVTLVDTLSGISSLSISGGSAVGVDPAAPVNISFSTDDATLGAFNLAGADFLVAMSSQPPSNNTFDISNLTGLPEPATLGIAGVLGVLALSRRRASRRPMR